MNFTGTGLTLGGDDFARAAQTIGCDEAAIRAVTFVEARGSGFDAKRRPIILFEPHVFYRNLDASRRSDAVKAGLAYARWQPGHYPATQDARYDQLNRAVAISEPPALMSASWGIGQVLGENYSLCRYASPEALVRDCLSGEGGQLDVMVRFILGRGLGDELRRRDWRGFAYGYNGPKYEQNDYHLKLARAYERLGSWRSAAYDPLADGLLSLGDKGDVVSVLQRAIGIHEDGDFGPMTEQAVKLFQREHGLAVDGKVGRQTGGLLGLHYWR